ncbi:MAG: archaeal proteasome endopeptidase complex subunit beta [Candidatus Aenigmarchaeota archaeon]|nr:archaeal proteasome endopeptidase complex subunit beta [Candidatus Aenigmarchaeota archaeon]
MTEVQQLKTGTTTVGIVCKDAVIIGTDKKATMGYMVESKEAQKIHQLDQHIGITIAGSVADALAIVRMLKAQFKLYRLERGAITLKAAATLLSNILHGSRYYPFMNQFILAGFDSTPHVYSFDPVGAFDEKDKFYSTGSGSPFAYGVLENNYKDGMSKEEGIELVIRAIKAAIQRDIASGGNGMLIAVIDKDGFKELTEAEIKKYN